MGEEGRTRIHEHAHEDGYGGKGQYVDVHQPVVHQYGGHHHENDYQRVEHAGGAQPAEVVLAIDAQIDGEEEDEDKHVERLAHCVHGRLMVAVALLQFHLV